MPTYEYECKKCAKRFEVVRGFNEKDGGTCPTCSREGHRIYAAPPLLFKGSGFYITDSRKKSGHSEEGGAPTPDSGKSGAEKPGKTEKPKPKLKVDIDKP